MSILTQSTSWSCEDHRSNNSNSYYRGRQEETECVGCLGDIICESKTRDQKRDQKAQIDACLLSAVHTVHLEEAKTPRQRGTSHFTTRRLFVSCRGKGDEGKQICHQREAVSAQTSLLNHKWLSQARTYFRMSTNKQKSKWRRHNGFFSRSSAMGPSSSPSASLATVEKLMQQTDNT